jgi:hypothetical protein
VLISGTVLKDKSNVTRTPKRQSERQNAGEAGGRTSNEIESLQELRMPIPFNPSRRDRRSTASQANLDRMTNNSENHAPQIINPDTQKVETLLFFANLSLLRLVMCYLTKLMKYSSLTRLLRLILCKQPKAFNTSPLNST